MNTLGRYIGVDVGGGGLRVCIDNDGTRTEQREVGGLSHVRGRIDVSVLADAVSRAVRTATPSVEPGTVDAITIGLTGLPGRLDDAGQLAQALKYWTTTGVVVIVNDSVIAHAGALGLTPGAVVCAGTGVIALGTDYNDVWNWADGWGHVLGDEGGGAWIGAAGLNAALHAYDHRHGGSAPLLARMEEQFGSPDDVVRRIHGDPIPARALASFAPTVTAVAAAGDPVAADICQRAANYLADDVATVVPTPDCTVTWTGGVFGAGPIILNPFIAKMHHVLPDLKITTPLGSPLDGAVALARIASRKKITSHKPYLYVYPEEVAA